MRNLRLKKMLFSLIITSFWILGIIASRAQIFASGTVAPPGVLLAGPKNNSGLNLEKTLVDIKAVDAPAVLSENGKTGVGSQIRYGQGIIIDQSGVIATNRHIIGNARHIFVVLSGGKSYEATVLQNSKADLCLIKINAPYPLRAVSLADPSEIQNGVHVIAITNAGLNPQRIRSGEVIKVFKEVSSNTIELMEMNITLKPGDSGGPILSQQGSLLGLIMGKQISDPSKSYAIASSRIQQEYFNYRNSILN